jgi:hypothetical protein
MTYLPRLITTAALCVALGTPALAKAEIKDNAEIFDRLLTAAIGHEIKENCTAIDVRTLAATFYVLGIVKYASDQGFSRAEMDAYRGDPTEQERLRQATYDYLDKNGVDRTDPASYCPLGQAEIEKKSQIGKLLKSR